MGFMFVGFTLQAAISRDLYCIVRSVFGVCLCGKRENKWHQRIICASLSNNHVIIWHSIILIRHFCKCGRNQLNLIINCGISFVLIKHCWKSKTNFHHVRMLSSSFISAQWTIRCISLCHMPSRTISLTTNYDVCVLCMWMRLGIKATKIIMHYVLAFVHKSFYR